MIDDGNGRRTLVITPEDINATPYQVITTANDPDHRYLVVQDSSGNNQFVVRRIGVEDNIHNHLAELVGSNNGVDGLIPDVREQHRFIEQDGRLYVIEATRLNSQDIVIDDGFSLHTLRQENIEYYVREVRSYNLFDDGSNLGSEVQLILNDSARLINVLEDDSGRFFQVYDDSQGHLATVETGSSTGYQAVNL